MFKASDCKFAVGELVRVKNRLMGGYDRNVLYAEAGDTGVVSHVSNASLSRPIHLEVLMDHPRLPNGYPVICFSEENLEPC